MKNHVTQVAIGVVALVLGLYIYDVIKAKKANKAAQAAPKASDSAAA